MSNHDSHNNQLQLAQQLFCANDSFNAVLRRSNASKASATIVFNDIIQLVKGNSLTDFSKRRSAIIEKINSDLNLRQLYLQLINKLKFAESGLQAAASTGETLPERITEHFSLKFKRDKNHVSQVYVILTINHPAEHHFNHAIAIHITTGEQVDCLYFPILADGRSQLLMEEDDDYLKSLTDNNSHLYLM